MQSYTDPSDPLSETLLTTGLTYNTSYLDGVSARCVFNGIVIITPHIAEVPFNHFKFRAECLYDVISLIESCIEQTMVISTPQQYNGCDIPDVDCEIFTSMSLDEVKQRMVVSGELHIAIETVALLEDYTGIRVAGEQ